MNPIEILMVEDNPADVGLVKACFQDCGVPVVIRVAVDGQEALDLLASGQVRPKLILLDLNLPRVDGHEVLESIKADGGRESLPVVVFSSSRNPADVSRAYRNGASGFITKPSTYDGFVAAIQEICRSWVEPLAGAQI